MSQLWMVTVSDSDRIHAIAKQLETHGFTIDEVFDQIGSLTGSATEAAAERVRSVDGVVDVSPLPTIDVGPPDASVT